MDSSGPADTAVLVVPYWGTRDEVGVMLRSLRGALSGSRHVTVLALAGNEQPREPRDELDLVELSVPPPDAAVRAVVSRAISEAATAGGFSWDWVPEPAATVLTGPWSASWAAALVVARQRRPALVIVAGTLGSGGLQLVSSVDSSSVAAVFPMASRASQLSNDSLALLSRADAVLAASRPEAEWLSARSGVTVADLGTYLDVRTEGLSRPWDGPYVAVVDSARDPVLVPGGIPRRGGAVNATARWLSEALPVDVLAVELGDVGVFRDGEEVRRSEVTSEPGVWSVLRFAAAAVVVEQRAVLARSAIEAMLLSVPVVAVSGSLAAEHVADAAGGLVVKEEAELADGVQAILGDQRAHGALGSAGRSWAFPRYGDGEGYERRVAEVVGRLEQS